MGVNFVSPTKEEYKLKEFENRVLMRILGPRLDGVERGWKKLHNEEIHCSYTSENIGT
jgi:hypothetical protein